MKLIIRGLILIGLVTGIVSGPLNRNAEGAQQLQPANDFSLKDLQSQKVSLSDFRGKVVLLNFFATWCPPCRAEIPELIKIFEQNRGKGLVILGISLDSDEIPFIVKNFVKKMKIPYPVLIGTEEVVQNYRIPGVPITLIINKEGKIIKRFEGLVPPRYFENALKDLLETRS